MPVFFWTSWNHPPTRIAASGYKRKHHDTVGSSAAGRPSRVINILQVLFLIIIRLPFVDLSEAVTSWMRKKKRNFQRKPASKPCECETTQELVCWNRGTLRCVWDLLLPCSHATMQATLFTFRFYGFGVIFSLSLLGKIHPLPFGHRLVEYIWVCLKMGPKKITLLNTDNYD